MCFYIQESAKINNLDGLITVTPGIVNYQKRNLWDDIAKKPSFANRMSRNNAQTISLDSFGFKRVSFLKVDVEGGDPLVIKGAQNLFRKKRVVSAVIEISPKFDFRTPVKNYIKW